MTTKPECDNIELLTTTDLVEKLFGSPDDDEKTLERLSVELTRRAEQHGQTVSQYLNGSLGQARLDDAEASHA